MTKCLSCGHFRHDLELNCPNCGSFYSKILSDFVLPDEPKKTPLKFVHKLNTHLVKNKQNHKFVIIIMIFLIILFGIFL
jgi:hypothetical protein